MEKFCGQCEAIHEVVVSKEVRSYDIRDVQVSAEITILKCSECGEEVYDKETEVQNDILLFDVYKKGQDLLTSKEIIAIRKKNNMSQATLSRVLGFGEKTITRYESGAIQDRAHDNLLRLIEDDENMLKIIKRNQQVLSDNEIKKIFSSLLYIQSATTSFIYDITKHYVKKHIKLDFKQEKVKDGDIDDYC